MWGMRVQLSSFNLAVRQYLPLLAVFNPRPCICPQPRARAFISWVKNGVLVHSSDVVGKWIPVCCCFAMQSSFSVCKEECWKKLKQNLCSVPPSPFPPNLCHHPFEAVHKCQLKLSALYGNSEGGQSRELSCWSSKCFWLYPVEII